MATRVAWGIDIGAASLKAVKLRRTGDEVEIEALDFVDYGPAAPGTGPSTRQTDGMAELIGRTDIRRQITALALPGQTALSRFIKLPPVEPAKVREMVGYEAQQQIPYDISEVNWGFHEVSRVGEEVEVGIFAVKRDLVVGHLSEHQALGVRPGVLTLTTLALYNLLRYDSPPADPTILLDIGSEHTDLVVIDGSRYWLRNLTLAGNDLTKAIAEKMKLSFDEAEKKKRNAGKDPQKNQILAALAPVLQDLISQVQRSIQYYKQQSQGTQIKKLMLLGDGSRIEGLDGYLQKNLGFKVDRFSRLQRITLGPDADQETLARHLPSFGVALGLGLQGVGLAENDVNLLPREALVKAEIQKKQPLLISAVALLYLAVFGLYFLKSQRLSDIAATMEQAQTDEVQELRDNEREIEGLQNNSAIVQQIEQLKQLTQDREVLAEFMNRLYRALDQGIRVNLPEGNGQLPDPLALTPQVGVDTARQAAFDAMQPLWLSQRQDDIWVLSIHAEVKAPAPAVEQQRGQPAQRPPAGGSRDQRPAGGGGTRNAPAGPAPRRTISGLITVATMWHGEDRQATYQHLQTYVMNRLTDAFSDGLSSAGVTTAGQPIDSWALTLQPVQQGQNQFGAEHHYMNVTYQWEWTPPAPGAPSGP